MNRPMYGRDSMTNDQRPKTKMTKPARTKGSFITEAIVVTHQTNDATCSSSAPSPPTTERWTERKPCLYCEINPIQW